MMGTDARSVRQILDKRLTGERFSDEQALALIEEGDLLELGFAADCVCRQLHPEPHRTYVVDRNINYTNICVSACSFCAFCRDINDSDAYLLSADDIFRRIEEAVQLGATQIMMQGGLHPGLRIEWYEELLGAVRSRFAVHLHSLSPPEIVHVARTSSIGIEETLSRLRKAGLDSVPGGGAEILTDRCRSVLSPVKCTAAEWLEVMEVAQSMGMPTTATMMFGHVETARDRVEHMMRVRDLQDRTGGFTAFIPWTFQPANTRLGGSAVGGHDYLRTLAVSRLVLDNIENIQASWVTQGPKIGQVALHFGANDLGGTMIEENVVAAAGATNRMGEQELRDAIAASGYAPKKRDTYYRLLE